VSIGAGATGESVLSGILAAGQDAEYIRHSCTDFAWSRSLASWPDAATTTCVMSLPTTSPHLYPFASLLGAGVDTTASSDATYGPLDPWEVIRAARERTPPRERCWGQRAGHAGHGAPADLSLLRVPSSFA
jgi:hypothetical protein